MKDRNAHSLIELLVVLIIVGILIAIVVPAVQRSREAARMAQCIHNQGQLAKAVHMHLADEPYGRFPGYRAFGADGTTVVGWAPQIFEYLGKSNQPADPAQATFIEVLTCPSDQGPTDRARLNYVTNGGQAGTDTPADGIFFDHAKPSRVYITKDDFLDGLTNTILMAENLDATYWNVTDEASQCILWPLVAGNEVNNGTGARPSSHHPDGFVTAFADGSVRFMADADINNDHSIYVALLTPGGNDSDSIDEPGSADPSPPPPPLDCDSSVTSCDEPIDPVAHYAFDNPGDLSKSSTGSNHATNVGATYEASGHNGGAAHFDSGKLDFIEITASGGMGSDQAGTVAMWIKTESPPPTNSRAAYHLYAPYFSSNRTYGEGFQSPDIGYEMNLSMAGSNGLSGASAAPQGLVAFIQRGVGGSASWWANSESEGGLGDGEWHHVAWTWDPDGDGVLYASGCEVGRATIAGTNVHQGAFVHSKLGRTNEIMGPDSIRSFNGWMDDVKLYTRALEPCEIAALYQASN